MLSFFQIVLSFLLLLDGGKRIYEESIEKNSRKRFTYCKIVIAMKQWFFFQVLYLTSDTLLNAALFQQLGEKGNEMENHEYQKKKLEELQKKIADACLSVHHFELVRTLVLLL